MNHSMMSTSSAKRNVTSCSGPAPSLSMPVSTEPVSPSVLATTPSTVSSSPFHSAVAGYVAGVSGTLIGYPMDTMKLWIQTNRLGENKHWTASSGVRNSSVTTNTPMTSGLGNSSSSTSSTTSTGWTTGSGTTTTTQRSVRMHSTSAALPLRVHAASSSTRTVQQLMTQQFMNVRSNLQALYSGVSVPLVTVGIVQSINFATYDTTRRLLFCKQQQQTNQYNNDYDRYRYRSQDSLTNVGIAGFVSGSVTAFVTAPLILIKTHQQITGSTFRQAVQQTLLQQQQSSLPSSYVRSINWQGCRAGLLPHLVCETVGRAVYYATYEGMKRAFVNARHQREQQHNVDQSLVTNGSTTVQERMFCAGASGIICWAVIFPLDALRSRIYSEYVSATGSKNSTSFSGLKSTPTSSTTSGLVQMIRTMHMERSFYRGFGITVLRAGPVAAVVLPVYDFVLDSLSSSS